MISSAGSKKFIANEKRYSDPYRDVTLDVVLWRPDGGEIRWWGFTMAEPRGGCYVKTYYVCCTGCRGYFNDNPKGVLAEYAERKAAAKSKK